MKSVSQKKQGRQRIPQIRCKHLSGCETAEPENYLRLLFGHIRTMHPAGANPVYSPIKYIGIGLNPLNSTDA